MVIIASIMPRPKKEVPKKPRKIYSKEELDTAVRALEKGMSYRKAEAKFGITASVLVKYRAKRVVTKQLGRSPVFSEEEERTIADHCHVVSDLGCPIGLEDLRYVVRGYLERIGRKVSVFRENLPGTKWVTNFVRRNSARLRIKKASNIKRARAEVTEEEIKAYLVNLEESLADVEPKYRINFDESAMQVSH